MKEIQHDKEKILIRACHRCHKLSESFQELQRCKHCNKSFLPLGYFDKIHTDKDSKWENRFCLSHEIEEEDLIKGLFVLW